MQFLKVMIAYAGAVAALSLMSAEQTSFIQARKYALDKRPEKCKRQRSTYVVESANNEIRSVIGVLFAFLLPIVTAVYFLINHIAADEESPATSFIQGKNSNYGKPGTGKTPPSFKSTLRQREVLRQECAVGFATYACIYTTTALVVAVAFFLWISQVWQRQSEDAELLKSFDDHYRTN